MDNFAGPPPGFIATVQPRIAQKIPKLCRPEVTPPVPDAPCSPEGENTMRLRGFIPMAVLCAGLCAAFSAAAPAMDASAAQQTGAKALQLRKFMKTPVSSSATRTMKKADGDYARLPTRRLKKKAARQPKPAPQPATPIEIASEATNAYASVMDAQVKVVAEDEVNEIDLAADANPIIPVAVATRTETAPIGAANEADAIDRTADKETVGIAPAPEPAASDPIATASEHKSWIQRVLDGLNVVVAAATTAVKALFA